MTVHQGVIELLAALHKIFVPLFHIAVRDGLCKIATMIKVRKSRQEVLKASINQNKLLDFCKDSLRMPHVKSYLHPSAEKCMWSVQSWDFSPKHTLHRSTALHCDRVYPYGSVCTQCPDMKFNYSVNNDTWFRACMCA